jgi:hypothetical protein
VLLLQCHLEVAVLDAELKNCHEAEKALAWRVKLSATITTTTMATTHLDLACGRASYCFHQPPLWPSFLLVLLLRWQLL